MEKNKKKITTIVCIVIAVIVAGLFGYYSVMNSRAKTIDALKGKSFSQVKKTIEKNGFSSKIVSSDTDLLAKVGHDDEWVVKKIKSDPWKRTTTVAIVPSPKAVTMAFLDGIKEDDHEKIKAVYEGEEFDIEEVAFINNGASSEGQDMDSQLSLRKEALYPRLKDFDYKINEESIDGDSAKVTIDINTYNIGVAYGKALSDYYAQALPIALSGGSNDQINAVLISVLRSNLEALTSKEYNKSTELELVKDGDSWKVKTIKRSDGFTNVITGGLRTAIDDLDKAS